MYTVRESMQGLPVVRSRRPGLTSRRDMETKIEIITPALVRRRGRTRKQQQQQQGSYIYETQSGGRRTRRSLSWPRSSRTAGKREQEAAEYAPMLQVSWDSSHSAPRLSRFIACLLRISASRNMLNKSIAVTAALALAPYYMLLYGALSNSVRVGTLMAVVRCISLIAYTVSMPRLNIHHFQVLQPDWQSLERTTWKNNLVTVCFLILVIVVSYPLVLFRLMDSDFVFGYTALTRYMCWYSVWTCPVAFLVHHLQTDGLMDCVLSHTSMLLVKRTKEYLSLQFKALQGASSAHMILRRMSHRQEKAEAWARFVNNAQSTVIGVSITSRAAWAIACIIGLLLVNDAQAVVLLGIIICYACFSLYRVTSFLSQVNSEWQQSRRRYMNKFHIGCRVNQLFGNYTNFLLHLEEHECSALRVFGLRITETLQHRFAGAVATTLTFATYLMVRHLEFT